VFLWHKWYLPQSSIQRNIVAFSYLDVVALSVGL